MTNNEDIIDKELHEFKKKIWNIFVNTSLSPKEAMSKYKEISLCNHPPTTDEKYILNFINHDEVERLLEILYEDCKQALEEKDDVLNLKKLEVVTLKSSIDQLNMMIKAKDKALKEIKNTIEAQDCFCTTYMDKIVLCDRCKLLDQIPSRNAKET